MLAEIKKLKIDHNAYASPKQQLVSYFKKKIEDNVFEPGKRLPTVREIVESVGVGTRTVSEAIKVLKNERLIETTKRGTFVKIPSESDVDNTGVDKLEVGFNKQVSSDIGLIVPDIRESSYSRFVEGVSSFLESQNHPSNLALFPTYDSVDKQASALLNILYKRLSGVLIIPPIVGSTPAFHVETLLRENIPVVFGHRNIPGIKAPLVTWDWEGLGRRVADEFIKRGHTKIAYVAALKYCVNESYERGLRKGLEAKGLELPEENVFYSRSFEMDGPVNTSNEQLVSDHLEKLLSSKNRPTAIFTCDLEVINAILLLVAYKLKLDVPGELSIIKFGEPKTDNMILNLGITSIGFDEIEVGRNAISILNEIKNGKRDIDDDQVYSCPLEFTLGGSLSDCPD